MADSTWLALAVGSAEQAAKRPKASRRARRGNLREQPLQDLQRFAAPPAVVYPGYFGDIRPRMHRPRRPDGTRGRPEPLEDLRPGFRISGPAAVDAERAARFDVMQSLAFGKELVTRPGWRVVYAATGRPMTIPHKGSPIKWGSVDDLVQAIATGAF